MTKYIDAEKLNSLIDNKLEDLGMSGSVWVGRSVLCELKQEIKSLQQEQQEVDLKKELDRYLRGEFQQTAGGNFNNYIQVARHFYELGKLNAKKEN